ncbi:MAG TPA: hypothetical protein VLA40_04035 [Rheinheimera sp.]|nr:hypothetical protein [Rheinheimera sp.]
MALRIKELAVEILHLIQLRLPAAAVAVLGREAAQTANLAGLVAVAHLFAALFLALLGLEQVIKELPEIAALLAEGKDLAVVVVVVIRTTRERKFLLLARMMEPLVLLLRLEVEHCQPCLAAADRD